jgi:hypothetical protein
MLKPPFAAAAAHGAATVRLVGLPPPATTSASSPRLLQPISGCARPCMRSRATEQLRSPPRVVQTWFAHHERRIALLAPAARHPRRQPAADQCLPPPSSAASRSPTPWPSFWSSTPTTRGASTPRQCARRDDWRSRSATAARRVQRRARVPGSAARRERAALAARTDAAGGTPAGHAHGAGGATALSAGPPARHVVAAATTHRRPSPLAPGRAQGATPPQAHPTQLQRDRRPDDADRACRPGQAAQATRPGSARPSVNASVLIAVGARHLAGEDVARLQAHRAHKALHWVFRPARLYVVTEEHALRSAGRDSAAAVGDGLDLHAPYRQTRRSLAPRKRGSVRSEWCKSTEALLSIVIE